MSTSALPRWGHIANHLCAGGKPCLELPVPSRWFAFTVLPRLASYRCHALPRPPCNPAPPGVVPTSTDHRSPRRQPPPFQHYVRLSAQLAHPPIIPSTEGRSSNTNVAIPWLVSGTATWPRRSCACPMRCNPTPEALHIPKMLSDRTTMSPDQ